MPFRRLSKLFLFSIRCIIFTLTSILNKQLALARQACELLFDKFFLILVVKYRLINVDLADFDPQDVDV